MLNPTRIRGMIGQSQWSQYLGLRPPDRGKWPRPRLLEKPPRKFVP